MFLNGLYHNYDSLAFFLFFKIDAVRLSYHDKRLPLNLSVSSATFWLPLFYEYLFIPSTYLVATVTEIFYNYFWYKYLYYRAY